MYLTTAFTALFRPFYFAGPRRMFGEESESPDLSRLGFISVTTTPDTDNTDTDATCHDDALGVVPELPPVGVRPPPEPTARDYAMYEYPTCPPKPTKPKSPAPGWTVVALRRPRCELNDEGELVWVFYYYTDGSHTRWFPPPPSSFCAATSADVEDAIDLTGTSKSDGLKSAVTIPVPEPGTYAKEISGGVPDEGMDICFECADPSEVEEVELTPHQKTFTLLLPNKLYMNPNPTQKSAIAECEKVGVSRYDASGKKRTKNELEQALRLHFIHNVFDGEIDEYLASDCFQGAKQAIDRSRKARPSAQRKAEAARAAKDAGKHKVSDKRVHAKAMPIAEAVSTYGSRGLFYTEQGGLRCRCKGTCMNGWDKTRIGRHFKSSSHEEWEKRREEEGIAQAFIAELNEKKTAEEEDRLQYVGTRRGNLSPQDVAHCKDTVKTLLASGIPLNKLGNDSILRKYIGRLSGLKLRHRSELGMYVTELLEEEEELQVRELKDSYVSVIADATPRQGDLLAVVTRSVFTSETKRRAFVVHRLIYISTCFGSLNAASLNAEISNALRNREIRHNRVPAFMMDRCFTNSAAMNTVNEAAMEIDELVRLISYCFSHPACNAGKEAGFVLLSLFWTLLQKIFAQSQQAQDSWKEFTEMAWPTYSETRWFSQYDVFEKLANAWGHMIPVIRSVVEKGCSPANSKKLLAVLIDSPRSWMLQIELSAYVEGLHEFRNLCYYLEAETTDLPFKCADRIDKFINKFSNGNMMKLPSTERLIMMALDWALTPVDEGGGGLVTEDATPRDPIPTLATVNQQIGAPPQRSQRSAAAVGVRNATQTLETPQQRRQREQREIAELQQAAAEAQAQEEHDAAALAALEAASRLSSANFPLTKEAFYAHIYSGIAPSITYFMERVSDGGDRHSALEFFRGARIFDPSYARSLSREQAILHIEKLKHYPVLCQGAEPIVDRLRDSWDAYKEEASRVFANFGRNDDGVDESAILTWHYRLNLRLELEDIDGLNVWWEACQLVSLVLPSSGTVERVFSLTENMFNDKQGSMLSDGLKLGLYTSYNRNK